jgi:putative phosphoribosyl transferase
MQRIKKEGGSMKERSIEILRDRVEAGRLLADELRSQYGDHPHGLVLALPRGGVPVAFPISQGLGLPLDIFLVRKLGVPGHEELAMGAIASGGVQVTNPEIIQLTHITGEDIHEAARKAWQELLRQEAALRGYHEVPQIQGKVVILVDDGIATGSTMLAAIQAVRKLNPQKIVVAVPVVAKSSCEELKHHADELVTLLTPEDFGAVGQWYEDFSQVSDEEVIEYLRRS